MASFSISLRNDSPGPSSGTRILFFNSRTQLDGAQLVLPDGHQLAELSLSPHGADAKWAPPLPIGAALELIVSGTGETISAARTLWLDESGALAVTPAAQNPDVDRALTANTAPLDALKNASAVRVQARADSLAQPELDHPLERAFFAEFDRATMAAATGSSSADPEILKEMTGVLRTLQSRLFDRCRGQPPRRCILNAAITMLSTLQRSLFIKHFRSANGPAGIDLDKLGLALLLFANGALHDAQFSEHGQPNGPALFFFAEFALVAVENGIDGNFWSALAPVLVQMQSVYRFAYEPEPRGGRHLWTDWSWSTLNLDGRPDDAALAQMLRALPAAPFDPLIEANLASSFATGVPQM